MSKKNLTKSLVVAVIVCICSFIWLGSINSRLDELQIEVRQKTSFQSAAGLVIKSFFDGFTFGRMSEEGIFTEYNKFNRWEQSVLDRAGRLDKEYSIANFLKYASISILIAAGLGLYFHSKKPI